jgi:hypothetical protein
MEEHKIQDLFKSIINSYPGRQCALTKDEWQLGEVINFIHKHKVGHLESICLLRRAFSMINNEGMGFIVKDKKSGRYYNGLGSWLKLVTAAMCYKDKIGITNPTSFDRAQFAGKMIEIEEVVIPINL